MKKGLTNGIYTYIGCCLSLIAACDENKSDISRIPVYPPAISGLTESGTPSFTLDEKGLFALVKGVKNIEYDAEVPSFFRWKITGNLTKGVKITSNTSGASVYYIKVF